MGLFELKNRLGGLFVVLRIEGGAAASLPRGSVADPLEDRRLALELLPMQFDD